MGNTRASTESLAALIGKVALACEAAKEDKEAAITSGFTNSEVTFSEERVPSFAREEMIKLGFVDGESYRVDRVNLTPTQFPEPRDYRHQIWFELERDKREKYAIRVNVGIKPVWVWADFFYK